MAIDLSEGMLARAEENVKKLALNNVDFFQMDAESPEFHSDYFDAVTCSFGLFFIPDMLKALQQWRRVTRSGGTILFSTFTENAFKNLLEVLLEDLEEFGLDVSGKTTASARLKDAETCARLMDEVELQDIRQDIVQVGYHLRNADEWWAVVWNAAMRGLVEQLDADVQTSFKTHHLKRVAKLSTADGLWLDVEVRLNMGTVA